CHELEAQIPQSPCGVIVSSNPLGRHYSERRHLAQHLPVSSSKTVESRPRNILGSPEISEGTRSRMTAVMPEPSRRPAPHQCTRGLRRAQHTKVELFTQPQITAARPRNR